MPVNAELDKMIVSAREEPAVRRRRHGGSARSRCGRGLCEPRLRARCAAAFEHLDQRSMQMRRSMAPCRCLAMGSEPPGFGEGDLPRDDPVFRFQAWRTRDGRSNARIVGPDAEPFLELVAHPSRLVAALARDPEQFAVKRDLVRNARRGDAGASRAKFDQLAFGALDFGLCPDRGAAGRASPRRTGDNGAAFVAALRQRLAALAGAIARDSGDPCRCRAGPDRCPSPCRGGDGCRHDRGSAR